MSPLPSFEVLRARHEQHQAAEFAGQFGEAEAALAAALEAVGWRAVGADAIEAVASLAEPIVDACVSGHRDPSVAARDLADLMRHYAPSHSDFLAPVEDFIPAAEEVLWHYAAGARPSRLEPPPI